MRKVEEAQIPQKLSPVLGLDILKDRPPSIGDSLDILSQELGLPGTLLVNTGGQVLRCLAAGPGAQNDVGVCVHIRTHAIHGTCVAV